VAVRGLSWSLRAASTELHTLQRLQHMSEGHMMRVHVSQHRRMPSCEEADLTKQEHARAALGAVLVAC
jgi:hypothetical protein